MTTIRRRAAPSELSVWPRWSVLALAGLIAAGAVCAQAVSPASPPSKPVVAAAPAPSAPAVSASGASAMVQRSPIFVLNSLDATISLIDPVSLKEIKRVPTGKEPHHLYMTPDERSVIVANALGNSLTFYDPHTGDVQRKVENIVDPYHLRFSPDMKWFITAANRLNHVDLYHVKRGANGTWDFELAKRIPAGKTPSHLMVDSKSTVVYASLQDSDQLMAIDLATQTPRWTVPIGKMPADIFLAPDDKTLLVGLTGDAVVEVYDVSGAAPKLIKRLPTGAGAHSFRAWGDKRHVLVSNRVANSISKIDLQTLTVVDTFPGPSGPDDMEVSPDRKRLYVASRWARKLTVVDTEKHSIIQQIDVGKSPHGVWMLEHAPRQ